MVTIINSIMKRFIIIPLLIVTITMFTSAFVTAAYINITKQSEAEVINSKKLSESRNELAIEVDNYIKSVAPKSQIESYALRSSAQRNFC